MKIMSWAALLMLIFARGESCVEVWDVWSDDMRHIVNLDTGIVTTYAMPTVANRAMDSPDDRYDAKLEARRQGDRRNRLMLTDHSHNISVLLAENVDYLEWSPDGTWLAYLQSRENYSPQRITLFNIETGARISDSLPENDWESLGIHWSPDGHLIAAVFVVERMFETSAVWLYAIPELKPIQTFETGLSRASVRWSPDGKTLAAYGTNNEFDFIEVASAHVSSLKLSGEGYYQLDWSQDGRYLLVKYSIGELGQWMTILNAQGEILVESTWITAHEWANNHQLLARVWTKSGLDDLTLFDLKSGEQRVIQPQVEFFTLSPDGRTVAATDTPDSIQIVDLAGIQPLKLIEMPEGMKSLIWRGNGQGLVALFDDRSLREFAFDSGGWRDIATVPGNEWMLRQAECSQGGV